MFVTKLRAGAFVLLASCTLASLTTLGCAPPQAPVSGAGAAARSKSRLFMPGGTLMYVNVYSTDPKVDQQDVDKFARVLWIDRRWARDVGSVRNLANRIPVIRIQLDPDRMRANKVSFKDIVRAVQPSRMFRDNDWLEAVMGEPFQSKENQNELLIAAWSVDARRSSMKTSW